MIAFYLTDLVYSLFFGGFRNISTVDSLRFNNPVVLSE